MERIRVAIIGGSGYGGGELLRLLASHPGVEVVSATSRKHAGRPVHAVHDNLLGTSEVVFTDDPPAAYAAAADLLFFALPHGEAATHMAAVVDASPEVRVIDLSGDFRLDDAAAWEAAYGQPHPAPELVPEFVYGLPELFRERIRGARLVANPGCFATGSILALAPLAAERILAGDVVSNGVTGSSGSGAEPKWTTHHPERAEDFRVYRPLDHQHVPEIEMALGSAGARDLKLAMVPHSGPFVRGIFTTAYFFPAEPVTPARLASIYEAFYADEPFVRLRGGSPRLATVRGTNWCDVGVAARPDGTQLTVMTAIDNLVKGMAGQAVQNLNLLFGFPETEGLGFPGTHP